MNRTRTLGLAVFLVAAVLAAGCAAPAAPAGKEKIVLAVAPTDNAAKIQASSAALEAFLEERTGADVTIHIPLSYAGIVETMRFGHAHVAMLGAWPAQLAASRAGAEVVLAEKREVSIGDKAEVQPFYFSYYVVKKDSPIQTLADLRGKTVALTSPSSTSGYIYPIARLVELGLVKAAADKVEANPQEFFGKVVLAGSYAAAWEQLKSGKVDAAVIAGDVSAKLYREVLDETRVVEQQGPVPSHAVVFAKGLDPAVAAKLKAAFLDLKGDKQQIMRDLVSGIFVEFTETTTEQHMGSLAKALELTGLKFGEKL